MRTLSFSKCEATANSLHEIITDTTEGDFVPEDIFFEDWEAEMLKALFQEDGPFFTVHSVFRGDYLEDENGNYYKAGLTFKLAATYSLGDDRWIEGSGFRLNLRAYLNDFRAAAEAVYAEIAVDEVVLS